MLDKLARGEVLEFAGIPSGTRVSDLFPGFSIDTDPWGQATLGSQHQKARFIVRKSVTEHELRVWFDESGLVLLVDFDYPGLEISPRDLFEDLGRADAVLDARDDILAHLNETVFGSRGLSFICDPDERFLVRIIAFSPTTAENYLKRLRVNP